MGTVNNIATGAILIGLFLIWWFIKKRPNKKYMLGSIFLTIIAFVLFGISDDGQQPKSSDTEKPATSKVVSSSSSSDKKKVKKEETKKASPSKETAKSKDKDEDELPYITAKQMPDFIEYLEQDLTEKGLDISDYTFTNKDTALYIYVPDDYKYYDKKDLQEFSDGMQVKVHESFNVWSAMNGVSYERYPMLYIKTSSNDSIASESAWNHEMKLKVK